MELTFLMKALMQTKRIYTLLSEVQDLSRQLAEALDRDDQVSIRMLISMRGEPMQKLQQARRALEEQRDALSPGERKRLVALLNGEAAEREEEAALAAQVQTNGRLLKQVIEMDKILNRRLTREKSIYQ